MADEIVNTKLLLSTADAAIWAREFMKVVRNGVEIDEDLMISWFANAFETQRTIVRKLLHGEYSA